MKEILNMLKGCFGKDIDEVVSELKEMCNVTFVDESIDDGCDDGEDEYVMEGSYDIELNRTRKHILFYYGNNTRTIGAIRTDNVFLC